MTLDAHDVYELANAAITALEAVGRPIPDSLELMRNEAEYEARRGLPDPLQLRAALDFRGRHEEYVMGEAG